MFVCKLDGCVEFCMRGMGVDGLYYYVFYYSFCGGRCMGKLCVCMMFCVIFSDGRVCKVW